MDGQFLFSRGWLLLLLEAAERNAIYPITMSQLHRLVYLGNVLAPVYNVSMPNSYTLKHMRGPYFDNVQWDIGRLVASGLVDVSNVETFFDENGFWLKADYRVSITGMETVRSLLELSSIRKISTFLREVMRAISDIEEDQVNNTADSDIHYVSSVEGKGIDISMPDKNFSHEAAIKLFPNNRVITSTESVHRYVSYLQLTSRGN